MFLCSFGSLDVANTSSSNTSNELLQNRFNCLTLKEWLEGLFWQNLKQFQKTLKKLVNFLAKLKKIKNNFKISDLLADPYRFIQSHFWKTRVGTETRSICMRSEYDTTRPCGHKYVSLVLFKKKKIKSVKHNFEQHKNIKTTSMMYRLQLTFHSSFR